MNLPLFLVPIVVAALAQIVKGLLHFARGNRNYKSFFMNGGIPSSHAAFVTSLVVSVALYEGVESTAFAISVILALIILHDAFAVRVHIGRNGKAVNALLRILRDKRGYEDLKDIPESVEITGHHPHEVVIGALFGLFLTVLLLVV